MVAPIRKFLVRYNKNNAGATLPLFTNFILVFTFKEIYNNCSYTHIYIKVALTEEIVYATFLLSLITFYYLIYNKEDWKIVFRDNDQRTTSTNDKEYGKYQIFQVTRMVVKSNVGNTKNVG